MTIKYFIAETDKDYHVKFGTEDSDLFGLTEKVARNLGYEILYRGRIEDSDKINVVLAVVKEANQSKRFDSKVLEKRLLE